MSAGASTPGTLTVTALNVGMNSEDSFKYKQGERRRKLADIVMSWLNGPGAAAVALNEIDPNIAAKLLDELRQRAPRNMDIQIATSLTNSLLWCVPQ